ncbi:hypothetical protein V6Z11_A02G121500 [Gossypium hirsutum]
MATAYTTNRRPHAHLTPPASTQATDKQTTSKKKEEAENKEQKKKEKIDNRSRMSRSSAIKGHIRLLCFGTHIRQSKKQYTSKKRLMSGFTFLYLHFRFFSFL